MDKKTEHDHHVIRLAEKIEALLIELAMQREEANRPAQREVITLSGSGYPYSANGYRYNGLYVAGGETVTVEYRGFQYSQVLQAGWNQLNLPDGCTVSTASTPFMVELVRDNVQYSQSVETASLIGTTPPLDTITPRMIATVHYSDFTVASANIVPYYPQVLTRNARERTIMVYNTMDVGLTTSNFAFYDSVLGIEGTPSISETGNLGFPPGSGSVSIGTSEESATNSQGIFASHVDSFQAILGVGSTLPTSGNVYIWVSELL